MDMNTFNVSATLNVFRLLARPTLCLPQATISTFNHLPIPLNRAFGRNKNVDIRAIVLDKDNCFAYPKANEVYKPYNVGILNPRIHCAVLEDFKNGEAITALQIEFI